MPRADFYRRIFTLPVLSADEQKEYHTNVGFALDICDVDHEK
jgi:hypothetical protein